MPRSSTKDVARYYLFLSGSTCRSKRDFIWRGVHPRLTAKSSTEITAGSPAGVRLRKRVCLPDEPISDEPRKDISSCLSEASGNRSTEMAPLERSLISNRYKTRRFQCET